MLKVDKQPPPRDVKGDKSKSVLFEACRFAKILESPEMTGIEEKWVMISHVWMKMLFYGATHYEWVQHGHRLRRGGELLTHVCLFIAHLGLSEQFQILDGEVKPILGHP